MAKFYTVKRFPGCGGLFAAVNHKGETVTPLRADESAAWLDGHHWSHAPTMFRKLGFKKRGDVYKARPFWGVDATIEKTSRGWLAVVTLDDSDFSEHVHTARTREAACDWVNKFGDGLLYTRNILNPDAGLIPIKRRDKGGCTDPGTERYHCM